MDTTPVQQASVDVRESVKILFWNVGKRQLDQRIVDLATDTSADVIFLAENGGDSTETLDRLQRVSKQFFRPTSIAEGRLQCFCRTPSLGLEEISHESRTSYRKMLFSGESICLVATHGVDLRNNDSDHRCGFAHELANEIRRVKLAFSLAAVVVGDLNMNPFDPGMWLPTALNAVPTRQCASKGTRAFNGKEYDLYYNPMWSVLGDGSPGPPGTIYDASAQGFPGWSVFDQALVHYSLVSLFRNVEILTTAAGQNLATPKGRPSRVAGSDHFPNLLTMGGSGNE